MNLPPPYQPQVIKPVTPHYQPPYQPQVIKLVTQPYQPQVIKAVTQHGQQICTCILILSCLCGIIIPIILFNKELNDWNENIIELKCNIINWKQIKLPNTHEKYIMDYYYNKDNYTQLHVSSVYNTREFIPNTSINQTCYINENILRFSKFDLNDRPEYILIIFGTL